MKGLIKSIFGRRHVRHIPRVRQRNYNAADTSRLHGDWAPSSMTGDAALRNSIRTLRDRARSLERDNDYVRRYLSALENNVLGSEGMDLQMKIRFRIGSFDTSANRAIEEAWAMWATSPTASFNWEDEWPDLQRLILRTTARDGGVFIRKRRGPDTNPFQFALEILEVDMLDMNYTDRLSNGNLVYMGIERDAARRVVGYWVRTRHPGDDNIPIIMQEDRVRIPAEEMIHYYLKERPTQSIGVPWIVSPMVRLHHLERYEESELMAARQGAEKGGWFQSETGEAFAGPTEVATDADGNKITQTLNDFEPQSFDELPAGMTFHPYSPEHPNPPFSDFVRTTLHGIAMGMDVDYPTLTGDLREANYSSMRSGKLEAQETWKKLQGHFIRKVCRPIFAEWLRMALLTEQIKSPTSREALPISKIAQFNQPKFRGRRWPWVDPKVDVQAAVTSIDAGLKTRTEVISENGGDLEDTFEQLAAEAAEAARLGLQLTGNSASTQGQNEVDEDPQEERD